MLTTKNAPALLGEIVEGDNEMVKIKLTRNTVVNGQPELGGKVVETDEQTARILIAIKKALPVMDEAPEVENREQDIKPARRRRKSKK